MTADIINYLKSTGFYADQELLSQHVVDTQALHETGPYTAHAVLVKDGVTALIEQNDARDNTGGLSMMVSHPPVLILSSAKGRVCITTLEDTALVDQVVKDLT